MSFFFSELIEIQTGFTKLFVITWTQMLIFSLHNRVLCELLLEYNEKYYAEEA